VVIPAFTEVNIADQVRTAIKFTVEDRVAATAPVVPLA